MLFQTCMTFFLHQNTKGHNLKDIGKLERIAAHFYMDIKHRDISQNICFFVEKKTDIHTNLEHLEGLVNDNSIFIFG